jgi:hypothetical protein
VHKLYHNINITLIKIFKLGYGSLAVYIDTILLFYFIVFVGNDRSHSIFGFLLCVFLALECYSISLYYPVHNTCCLDLKYKST